MKNHRPLVTALALSTLATSAFAASMTVTVSNPSGLARPSETIDIPYSEILARIPSAFPDHLKVTDAASTSLPNQFTNFNQEIRKGQYDDFLFQHDFAAGEKSATFTIETTEKPVPPFPRLTFARYIPERFDDFAWENDRIAHRIYGPGLETPAAKTDQMVASGVDVWSKEVRYLIVDRWYLRSHNNYHKDNGEGLDMYDTGKFRGCGGTGIWDGNQLYVSRNWTTWKILANGPVRTIFELTYAPWDGGGFKVSETKRFTVDAGHNLDQIESTFVSDTKPEFTVAIGLSKHPKAAPTTATENKDQGSVTLWEKYVTDGQLGTAILLAPEFKAAFAEIKTDYLMTTTARSGVPVKYFAGAGWDRSGDFSSQDDWNAYVNAQAARLAAPVSLSYSPVPSASPAP